MGVVYEAEQESLGPPRGPEGPARPRARSTPSSCARFQPRGAGGGPAAPHQHRAGLRRRRAGRARTTTSCSSSTGRASTRCSTSCGGCARRRGRRRRPDEPAEPAERPRRRSRSLTAADVARSLVDRPVRGRRPIPPGEPAPDPVAARPEPPAPAAAEADSRPTRRPRSCPAQSELSALSDSDRRLYCRSVARIGVQVAEALAYAHRQGVLHRDIKPSNLLLDAARQRLGHRLRPGQGGDGDDLTHTGDILGTLRYMAPERFRGPVRRRGRRLRPGPDALRAAGPAAGVRGGRPARLIERVHARGAGRGCGSSTRAIPRDLETIVLKAIDEDPAQRYATAGGAGRGPAAVPGGPADPGAADRPGRAGLAVVPAQPGGGRPAGRRWSASCWPGRRPPPITRSGARGERRPCEQAD